MLSPRWTSAGIPRLIAGLVARLVGHETLIEAAYFISPSGPRPNRQNVSFPKTSES